MRVRLRVRARAGVKVRTRAGVRFRARPRGRARCEGTFLQMCLRVDSTSTTLTFHAPSRKVAMSLAW